MMATLQATACHALEPTGVPVSSARSVSITGWCDAKPCSDEGIVWIGTNALEG